MRGGGPVGGGAKGGLVLALALVASAPLVACAGSGSAPWSGLDKAVAKTLDPWDAIARGDLATAEIGFERLTTTPFGRAAGLVGLLAVAVTRGDSETIRRLLARVDAKTAPADVVFAAASAAATLDVLPPNGKALLERVCAMKAVPGIGPQAGAQICAELGVFRHAHRLDRCTAGCEAGTTLPISFAGRTPAVMVSVNGHPPAMFVVDSGSGMSMVTRAYARSIGLKPLAHSTFAVATPGRPVAARLALVRLTAGGVTIDDAPVIIADLPDSPASGIVSPQATWSAFAVDIDLRKLVVRLSRHAATDADLVAMPLLRVQDGPYVLAAVAGRPKRAFKLDTGADDTVLFTAFDRLGAPLGRGRSITTSGLGNDHMTEHETDARLPLRAGGLEMTIERPHVAGGGTLSRGQVTVYGLLGMDVLMGRHLVIDTPARRVLVSRTVELSPWKVGEETTWLASGAYLLEPCKVHEKVVARTTGKVTLDVRVDKESGHQHFRIEMPDTWASRGTWLLSRPDDAMWDVGANGKTTPVPPKLQLYRWTDAVVPFSQTNHRAELTFGTRTLHGRPIRCTIITADATSLKEPARVSFTVCPKDPWRMRSIVLRAGKDGDGEVLWQLRQAPR